MGKAPRRRIVRLVAPLTEAGARTALTTFLEAHPKSAIEMIRRPEGNRLAVTKPWEDESFVILLPPKPKPVIDALNSVLLPTRYSAIWHRDTRDVEILWTAFQPGIPDVAGRSFQFTWNETTYKCEFARASERALILAEHYVPIGPSASNQRNLASFQLWATNKPIRDVLKSEPLSFWVRNFAWNEDEMLDLALHLNFYLKYFDDLSPTILIHPPAAEETWNARNRYIDGAFPHTIRSLIIDPNALFLWEAARTGDNARRFLYYYRIIEYSAVPYLDHTARTGLRIALAAPNALDDIFSVTDNVVAAVQRMKLDEYQRYTTMLKEIVKPSYLWREIQTNVGAFTSETEFDGGFKLEAMIKPTTTEADFGEHDVGLFATAVRDIRNHLTHGRDPKSALMIAPTTPNFVKLQPWVGVAALMASQVLLYKDVF